VHEMLRIGLFGSPGASVMSFEQAIESIMDDLECTWAEAEYFDKQADEADFKFELEREGI